MKNLYRLLVTRALPAVILGPLAFTGVQAQSNSSVMEEVIVTATKREQTLQDTPIAVTVTPQETIEQAKILDLKDLQTVVPSLRVTTYTRADDVNFAIRGFGNGGSAIGTEPAVGVFIDGVFRSRSSSMILDLPRVQRIEVLRGPQSTLFGKNASAGVISVISQAPSFERQAGVEATMGNYNQYILKGYVTGAISDTLALSASANINRRDGFTESIVGNADVNDKDRWTLRGQALYQPTGNISVRVIADYSRIDEMCCTIGNVVNGGTAAVIQALGDQVLSTDDQFAYESVVDSDPVSKLKDGGLSVHVDVDFESFTLTSITAYRNNQRGPQDGDIDYTSADLATGFSQREIETYSQEFRLTSDSTGPISWMVGSYLFKEEIIDGPGHTLYGDDLRPYVFTLVGGPNGPLGMLETMTGNDGEFFKAGTKIVGKFTQDNDAYSIFGTVDYRLTDTLTATVGLSYTNDDKEVTINQISNPDVFGRLDLSTLFGGAFAPLKSLQFRPPQLGLPNAVEDGKSSDDDTTWLARLAWEMNDNVNFYASAATGFKSSSWVLDGFSHPSRFDADALAAAGIETVNQQYTSRKSDPEYATVYELGLRARFNKAAFSFTLFDQSIEDFQTRAFDGVNFISTNAGELSSDGFEFDVQYYPTPNWTLSVAGTYLDPIYEEYEGAPPPVGQSGAIDRSGTRPGGIHNVSMAATIVYNFVLRNASGYVRTNYLYERSTGLTDQFPQYSRQVNTVNASAGLDFSNGIGLQVWARNLNNDEYYTGAFPGVAQPGTVNSFLNPPRLYGVSISYMM